ncbi:MAG: protein kinase [Anaerolineales bacterium]
MKDPLIGQQLANFRIDGLLGHGGMATVYFGQDVKLQRPVAIKVIDKKYRNDPAYTKRFVNEARMMAKWRHENIVQIYYADEEQGFSYYVMEYVDGQDLSSIMHLYAEQKTLMPVADVLRIGTSIASALDYAHRQGVIHRDIKPSNILISKDGRVLLGDFGMALEVRDGSMGNIFGTPHYISPEQAKRSADAIPQSDLYSLGVILYETLSGSVPFNDPSPASIALQHISQRPPSPRMFNPQITPAVEAVLLKSLEKDPRNRYQTGAKLMSALSDAIKFTDSSPKIPLPPLPVGVPTIRHSNISIDQFAKLESPKKVKVPVEQPKPATVRTNKQTKSQKLWAILFLLLLLGLGAWYYTQKGLLLNIASPTSTGIVALPSSTELPAQPTQTITQPTNVPPSATATFTEEVPTNTPIQVVTDTPAPTNTPAPTDTPQPTFTPAFVPTIKYPNGFRFSFFWNDTSFHMLNNVGDPRSLSAFAFERLDANGNPTDRFTGHRWENGAFNYLPIGLCVSIKIYGDEDPPYIDPPECHHAYASIVQPRKEQDRALFFWNNKNDGSTEFRVLFAGEEVGRCQISAGTCEVYIP